MKKTTLILLLVCAGSLQAQTNASHDVLAYYDAELIKINADFVSGINLNYQGSSYPLLMGMSWQIYDVLATDKNAHRLADDYAWKNVLGNVLIISGALMLSTSGYLMVSQTDQPLAQGLSWGTAGLLAGALLEVVGVPLYHSGFQDAVIAVNTYNRNKVVALAGQP